MASSPPSGGESPLAELRSAFSNILKGALSSLKPKGFTDILVPERYAHNFLVKERVNTMLPSEECEAVAAWEELGGTVPPNHFIVILIDNSIPSPDFNGRVRVKFIEKD